MARFSFSRAHLARAAALAAAGVALAAGRAPAQGSPAVLAVTVRASGTNQPLQGARVVLEGTGLEGVTNGAGRIRFAHLPPGPRTVHVRLLGHSPRRLPVELQEGLERELEVELAADVVPLDPVTGEVNPGSRGIRMLRGMGFYERKNTGGGGIFIEREQIEKARPRQMTDLLRRFTMSLKFETPTVGRVRVGSRRVSGPVAACPPMVYLNGVPAAGYNLDDVRPDDVEGVEIYSGPSEVPPQFRQVSGCGVIVLWTRVN